MDNLPFLTSLASGILLGALIMLLYFRSRTGALQAEKAGIVLTRDVALQRVDELRQDLGAAQQRSEIQQEEISRLRAELASGQTRLSLQQEKLAETVAARQEQAELMKAEFERLAYSIVQRTSNQVQENQAEKLTALLSPLQTKLGEFREKVEKTHEDRIREHADLKSKIMELTTLNKEIGDQAMHLTKALKGDSKTRGNWGENILLTILEKCGLEKGIQYQVQATETDAEGRRQIPDVVINLPDNKSLVIDSKLSLVDYERYVNDEDVTLREKHLKGHLASIRRHIRELSEKKYEDLHGISSPDFVLLFMPVEPAFNLAVGEDPALYNEAFAKNIILISNSTLLATLKTVAGIWKQEYQSKNAQEIARQAGNMVDKFADFVKNLDNVGLHLQRATDAHAEAINKLHTGKGNLINRAQKLKALGVPSKKELPEGEEEGVE